jgi:hypothetical protein
MAEAVREVDECGGGAHCGVGLCDVRCHAGAGSADRVLASSRYACMNACPTMARRLSMEPLSPLAGTAGARQRTALG